MQSALEIPELLLLIFSYTLSSSSDLHSNRVWLAGLARVCKSFQGPALSFLWNTLDSIIPLLLLLPVRIVHSKRITYIGAGRRVTLELESSITQQDLERFERYTKLVRHIQCGQIHKQELRIWNAPAIHAFAHSLVAKSVLPTPLLPRLSTITWMPWTEEDVETEEIEEIPTKHELFFDLMSQDLLEVTIGSEDMDFLRKVCASLQECQHLRSVDMCTVRGGLKVYGEESMSESFTTFFRQSRAMQCLERIRVGSMDLSDDAVQALSALPQLNHLQVYTHHPSWPQFPSLRSVELSSDPQSALSIVDNLSNLEEFSIWVAESDCLSLTSMTDPDLARALLRIQSGNRETLKKLHVVVRLSHFSWTANILPKLDFPNLVEIKLGIVPSIIFSEGLLEEFALAIPSIQSISINRCQYPYVSVWSILTLLHRCRELEHLDLAFDGQNISSIGRSWEIFEAVYEAQPLPVPKLRTWDVGPSTIGHKADDLLRVFRTYLPGLKVDIQFRRTFFPKVWMGVQRGLSRG